MLRRPNQPDTVPGSFVLRCVLLRVVAPCPIHFNLPPEFRTIESVTDSVLAPSSLT